jgi:hypothetical protein
MMLYVELAPHPRGYDYLFVESFRMVCVVWGDTIALHAPSAIKVVAACIGGRLVDAAAPVKWSVGVMLSEDFDGGLLCGVWGGQGHNNSGL